MKKFMLVLGISLCVEGNVARCRKSQRLGTVCGDEVSQLTPIYIHITLYFPFVTSYTPYCLYIYTYTYSNIIILNYTYILYDVAYHT